MAVFLWLLLFFGGAITPQIIGIMLNSVAENKKISANSLAQLAFNLIGYLPAPTFYGFVAQLCSDENSKIPMGCLLSTTVITIAFLIFAIHKKLENEEKYTILSRLTGKPLKAELDKINEQAPSTEKQTENSPAYKNIIKYEVIEDKDDSKAGSIQWKE
jgi:hypothetical protein